ncbi:MarR family transcriptional regulator [Alishewanella longhuensis]|uniref:MarR family transcriptional regulator n=1 Tax=Alishewanella longhuensis TaxID=1091037 RepID=A0ABQ3L2C6_9ALTE|nr:MarR family transcriptional regulator [Alishewanella longhuensis]GHG60420.1 MarR family transcriptional regulator [Alishewanella longhuensis]
MDELDRIQQAWATEIPALDTSSMALIGRLQIVHKRLSQGMSANFRQFGLTDAGFDVLATLRRSGAPYQLTPNQLLAQTLITSGSLTSRLQSLEKQGFITRSCASNDKRSIEVTLTANGKTVIEQALVAHVATQQQLLNGLSHTEQQQLVLLLRAFIQATA